MTLATRIEEQAKSLCEKIESMGLVGDEALAVDLGALSFRTARRLRDAGNSIANRFRDRVETDFVVVPGTKARAVVKPSKARVHKVEALETGLRERGITREDFFKYFQIQAIDLKGDPEDLPEHFQHLIRTDGPNRVQFYD